MNDREVLVDQQNLQSINQRANEPFSLRVSVLLWILLATLTWMAIFGAGMLFFG